MDASILVTVSLTTPGNTLPDFSYKVVCKVRPPRSRDMSAAFVLFSMAILINYLAIKKLPKLEIVESLPEEE